MKHKPAMIVAGRALALLRPWCDRIEIGGSLRRLKGDVKDAEIVCIPTRVKEGLFDEDLVLHPSFVRAVNAWPAVKGEATGKYTQRILGNFDGKADFHLDLFMATPENWGLIFAIRTGSAEWCHYVLMKQIIATGYRSEDGMLRQGGKVIPVHEERELFDLIGLPWVEPKDRVVAQQIVQPPAAKMFQEQPVTNPIQDPGCFGCDWVRIAGLVFPCICQHASHIRAGRAQIPAASEIESGCQHHTKRGR